VKCFNAERGVHQPATTAPTAALHITDCFP
jgi:hypothetical protein